LSGSSTWVFPGDRGPNRVIARTLDRLPGQLPKEALQMPMEITAPDGTNHPDDHVHATECVTLPAEALTDDPFHPISVVSARNRLLPHDQTQPGSTHSIEKRIHT
jgi:hypothetical protein